MELTYFLAQIFGITLIATALTVLFERKMMMEVLEGLVNNRALLYVLGILDLILGLAVVLTHNIWMPENSLVTTVTIMGWLLLIKGVVRMTIPSASIKKTFKSKKFARLIPIAGVLALILGAYLTYQGFMMGGY